MTVATVLIAPAEQLPTLQRRAVVGEVIPFADIDVLQALEAITSLKPAVVALERVFSETSRGTALINRIKADTSLKGCDIQIVSAGGHSETAEAADGPSYVVVPSDLPPAPLDYRGTRKAERFAIVDGVEVLVEGEPASLVNLSVIGAQVISTAPLKPNQRVRFSLSTEPGATRLKAVVAWASFELPKGAARYRAGIELFGVDDHSALVKFIEAKKK